MFVRSLITLLLLLVPLALVADDTTRIEFDPPTSREDGTELDPATEIAQYDLYCRYKEAEEFARDGSVLTIPGMTETGEHETTYGEFLPERGRYDCALTATDTDGRESDYSEIVEVSWLDAPGSPTNVIIVR